MFLIKQKILCCLLTVVPMVAKAATVDPVDLFKRHHYEEAAAIWEKDVRSTPLDDKGVRSLKGLSLAYSQMGSLYSRLHPFSLALANEYYEEVLSQANSPLALFYLGQVQYQRDQWDSAIASFEKVGKSETRSQNKFSEVNTVFLAYAKAKQEKAANPPLPQSSLAKWQALDLAKAQPSEIPAGLKADSPRARRCRLSILARSPTPMIVETYAALQAVLKDDVRPEVSQDPGRSTQLDFYDPFLMETLSRACYSLSQWWQMQLLVEEKRFPDLAQKFNTRRSLSETSLLRGQYSDALQYLGVDDDVEARILRAKILGKQGKLSEARALLEGVAHSAKSPAILREIAESYYFLGIDLDTGLRWVSQALKDKDGANYYRISAELLLATGQNDAALVEYAKGYNEEFRNQIDQIDPEYMSDYAFAIFLTNKTRYEEIVETLYHLQKDIPACRQMHYAMQGISAGLARNYEAQHIFRKGG